ncbi:MAG: 2-oxoglutarate and iron-dependent oxygenase domain-containing protein [bacterium]
MDTTKERGIKALNQEYTEYDQVNKEQAYHLAEADEDQFDEEYKIKTCDLGRFFNEGEAGKAKFAQELGEAMEGIGFVILDGHGVGPKLHEEGIEKTREFFETTTVDERMKYLAQRHGSVNEGYFPIKETSRIHPDLVEGWVFCRRAFNLKNDPNYNEKDFWPKPGFEAFFRQIVLEHEKLILPVMQSILRYFGCDPHLYDTKLTGTNFGQVSKEQGFSLDEFF